MNKLINVVENIKNVKKDCIYICNTNNLDPNTFNCSDNIRELEILIEKFKEYELKGNEKIDNNLIKDYREKLKYYKTVYEKLQYIEKLQIN